MRLIFLYQIIYSRSKNPSLNVSSANENEGMDFIMFKNNYDAKEFGNRIRIIRKKNKMTQEQLAEKLFLSVDSISKIENGRVMCMPDHIVHICEMFKISSDYLYFGAKSTPSSKIDKLANIEKLLMNCEDEDIRRIEQMITLFLRK